MRLYLNLFTAHLLFWYATSGNPDLPIDPPSWTMYVSSWLDLEGQEYCWHLFSHAGLAYYEYETFHDYWFEGTYYILYRRATGRSLPYERDYNFGWRELHPKEETK